LGKTATSVSLPPSLLYCCLAEEKHRKFEEKTSAEYLRVLRRGGGPFEELGGGLRNKVCSFSSSSMKVSSLP